MIRATFKSITNDEIGTILQWEKPNVHLSPYHMNVIKNYGFNEFNTPEDKPEMVKCEIEVDRKLVVTMYFVKYLEYVITTTQSVDSCKVYVRKYEKERCL